MMGSARNELGANLRFSDYGLPFSDSKLDITGGGSRM